MKDGRMLVRHTDFCVEKRVADMPRRVRRAIDSGLP